MDFDDFDDRDQKEVNDILPDTNVDRERTLSGKWALGLLCLAGFLTTLAFVAPNWVEGDPRFYGNKLDKLGLWVHCFRSIPDYNDLDHRRFFAGCRWIFNPFTEGYAEIRNYLVPRKCTVGLRHGMSLQHHQTHVYLYKIFTTYHHFEIFMP